MNLSLLPVMGGLAICSANELSFNMMGFIAALATNISECGQNVYSKMLISGDAFKYTPAEMQFYTSAASLVVALPVKTWTMYVAEDAARGVHFLKPAVAIASLANQSCKACSS